MTARYQPAGASETVASVLRTMAEGHPEKVCLVAGAVEITYDELNRDVNRLANALSGLGLGKGDKLGLLMPNVPEFVTSYFAGAKLGAVVVPVNIKFRGEEIRYVLENSDATALLIADDFIQAFNSMSFRPPKLREVIVLGRGDNVATVRDAPTRSFRQLLRQGSEQEVASPCSADDVFGIFYTSGTTDVPKGVLLTHRQIIAGADAWRDGLEVTADTRSLVIAPFFHIAFNAFVFSVLLAGGSSVIVESFQLKRLLKEIERCRVTMIFATPSVFITMLDFTQMDEYDLSSLQTIVYGAAPMPVEVIHQLRARLKGALYNGYGQTETSGAISRLRPQFAISKAGSIGTPLQGLELAILDEEDHPVAHDVVGEICCRGANTLTEYYKLPEVTAKKLRGGWLHTGDLGYLDADGFLYIVDRKDDIIISHGEKVSPKEVEEVLYTYPDLLDAAVVGIPDRVRGEAVVAFVVPKAGKELDIVAVRRYCRERLAAYKAPRAVYIVASIPRNPAGKVMRQELRTRGAITTMAVPS